jgi:hypothetical protein
MKTKDAMEGHTDTRATGEARSSMSLHIDRMVIDGVPLSAGQCSHLKAAVLKEFRRLMQSDGLGSDFQSGAVSALEAPSIRISPATHPAEMGRQIARSIHKTLKSSL